jgi:hypothetical protein
MSAQHSRQQLALRQHPFVRAHAQPRRAVRHTQTHTDTQTHRHTHAYTYMRVCVFVSDAKRKRALHEQTERAARGEQHTALLQRDSKHCDRVSVACRMRSMHSMQHHAIVWREMSLSRNFNAMRDPNPNANGTANDACDPHANANANADCERFEFEFAFGNCKHRDDRWNRCSARSHRRCNCRDRHVPQTRQRANELR